MTDMTKMLIDIDENLLAELMRLTGAKTKKAAVAEALEDARRRAAFRDYLDFLASPAMDDFRDPAIMAGAQR